MSGETQTTSSEAQGTGTDSLQETQGQIDPNWSRKQIYARAAAGTQAEVDIDRATHESVESLSAAIEGGDPVEEINAEYAEQVREQQEREERERAEAAGSTEVAEAPAAPASGAEAKVTLKVFGDDIEIPASEVERLGGVEAAQKFLAADFRFRQATQLAQQAKELYKAAEERQKEISELEERVRGQAGATPPSDQQPNAQDQGRPADEAIRAAAKKLTGEMFSGDPQRIEDTLTEILAMRPSGGPSASAEDIANLAVARMEKKRLLEEAEQRNNAKTAALEQERIALNAMMREKYGAIVNDDELREITFSLFSRMKDDPRNKGRSLVSIGDECGAKVAAKFGVQVGSRPEDAIKPEIQARANLKRRIPSLSASADRAPSGESEDRPMTNAEVVNMLRAARGQPPM